MDLLRSLVTALAYSAPAVCLVAFAIALVSACKMTKHRADDVSLWRLATNGLLFYSGKGFKPEAEPYRRRFVAAALVFLAAILVGMVSGVVLASLGPKS
jgi:hypothetical protein